MIENERTKILRSSVIERRQSVMNYQINIDNFRLAIEKIEAEHSKKPHMVKFAEHLKDLMRSSIEEQDKEAIILEVIEQQLEGQ